MQNIDIEIEDPRWQTIGFDMFAPKVLVAALNDLGVAAEVAELSILACDDARISTLNADFRGKPTPTNVLSWPAEERAAQVAGGTPDAPTPGPDGLVELGDIAISFDTCLKEAQAAGIPTQDHVTHLLVHGVLHLLGYDHILDPDAERMEHLEAKILGNLGIANPYKDT